MLGKIFGLSVRSPVGELLNFLKQKSARHEWPAFSLEGSALGKDLCRSWWLFLILTCGAYFHSFSELKPN